MRARSVGEVLDLYYRFGDDGYDEDVSQLAHGLQTAALAEAESSSDHLVVAALLHDVGHLLELRTGQSRRGDLDDRHEAVGARFLGGLFGNAVTNPVLLHVAAKRYRVSVDPEYLRCLSPGSVASLHMQGGPLDDAAISSFESARGFRDAVQLRKWDDMGKVDGLATRSMGQYVSMLERLASEERARHVH
jgi:predicted HD phosphohydrolase